MKVTLGDYSKDKRKKKRKILQRSGKKKEVRGKHTDLSFKICTNSFQYWNKSYTLTASVMLDVFQHVQELTSVCA